MGRIFRLHFSRGRSSEAQPQTPRNGQDVEKEERNHRIICPPPEEVVLHSCFHLYKSNIKLFGLKVTNFTEENSLPVWFSNRKKIVAYNEQLSCRD